MMTVKMIPQRSRRIGRGFQIVALSSLLMACSSDMTDLQEFVQQAKAARKSRIEPLPEIRPHETFKYAASGLRDPFEKIQFNRPAVSDSRAGQGSGPRPIQDRPREALEAFPLDSLRLVGFLEQQEAVWALVSATDGTIHRVTTGNYLGQNHGKIIGIDESRVALMEIVPDGLGDYTERSASLVISE